MRKLCWHSISHKVIITFVPHVRICIVKTGVCGYCAAFVIPSDNSLVKRPKSLVVALLQFESFIVTDSTVIDELVVSRNASQVDQRLARFARNIVAHVPRVGFR